MALVTYGSSSSESEDNDDDASKPAPSIPDVFRNANEHLLPDIHMKPEKSVPTSSGEVVEEEYKMRIPKSAQTASVLLNVSKSRNGKVLLSLPGLDTLDSSDDTDDESAAEKSRKPSRTMGSTTGSGLLSLLPPTRALIIREGSKPILVPHQVRTRETKGKGAHPSASTTKPCQHQQHYCDNSNPVNDGRNAQENAVREDEEVEEEEEKEEGVSGSAFFSFDSRVSSDQCVAEQVACARAVAQAAVRAPVPLPTPRVFETPMEEHVPPVGATGQPSIQPSKTKPPGEEQDEEGYWTEETFLPGPERKRARLTAPDPRSFVPVTELLARSKTSITEVKQDDLTVGSQIELMKSITSEEKQYVHRPPADDNPGGLAHRKHQITWLAYKAQEDEMELQNRWADARRNHTISRSKYGF